MALVVLEVDKPIIEDFLDRYMEYVTKTLSGFPEVLFVAKSGKEKIVALVGGEDRDKLLKFIEENIESIPTLRSVQVLPISEIKKGDEISGFLAEV